MYENGQLEHLKEFYRECKDNFQEVRERAFDPSQPQPPPLDGGIEPKTEGLFGKVRNET
jgi:hypothetical protein